MIQIKMLPDWSILNYLNRRRPDVPEHDFLKIFGEFWVFWNSKILIILRLRFFHSGTSDSVMNKMTSNDSRMTQIWPKIDILMTCLNFISRWSVDWMKPDIDAIELTKYVPMKPTHWFIDTMIYWIFQFFSLEELSKESPGPYFVPPRGILRRWYREGLHRELFFGLFLRFLWSKIPYLSTNDHHWNPQK